MRKSTAALAAALIAVLLVPLAGRAAIDCAVVWDPADDVAGPLGTPRPAKMSGANVDILGVSMAGSADALRVFMTIRDLRARPTAGTDGAFYGVFWTLGIDRYFAQAIRVSETQFQFQAGHAAGTEDHLPQQGLPVNGYFSRGMIRIDVPLPLAGGPDAGELLQQVRARTEESALRSPETLDVNAPLDHVATLSDAAGGLEGGRYLFGGVCLGLLSAAGERCIIATDSSRDAKAGAAYDATRGTDLEPVTKGTAYGAVDPATEILSMQMGANPSTLVVELGVASLRHPVPDGADAQRWEVEWTIGLRSFRAFAERRTSSHTFGYSVSGSEVPTSGSISPASGTIRILVPRHEAGADGLARLVNIFARSELIIGATVNRDWRDTVGGGFATQFVSGVSCADQEKAACPVVLDAIGDARVADPVTEEQPASDMTAGGAAGPLGELVLSVRVADIGAPLPDGFDRQGWTLSWIHGPWRYYAQAERTARETVFRYGIAGTASETSGPVGARFNASLKADGVFDLRNGVIGITVPRSGVGDPVDGVRLTELGVTSWIMKHGSPASPDLTVDQTPLAAYRVGLACSA